MTDDVIALLMLVNNEIKEARIQPDLSVLLKEKLIDKYLIMLSIDV